MTRLANGSVVVFGGTAGSPRNDLWLYAPPLCAPTCANDGLCDGTLCQVVGTRRECFFSDTHQRHGLVRWHRLQRRQLSGEFASDADGRSLSDRSHPDAGVRQRLPERRSVRGAQRLRLCDGDAQRPRGVRRAVSGAPLAAARFAAHLASRCRTIAATASCSSRLSSATTATTSKPTAATSVGASHLTLFVAPPVRSGRCDAALSADQERIMFVCLSFSGRVRCCRALRRRRQVPTRPLCQRHCVSRQLWSGMCVVRVFSSGVSV